MRALLDTHALLWWFSDDPALTRPVRKIIGDTKNTVVVSAASAWEIATKVRLGKLPTGAGLAADFTGCIEREHFQLLPISVEHRSAPDSSPAPTGTRSTACSSPKPKRKTSPSSAKKLSSTRSGFAVFGRPLPTPPAWQRNSLHRVHRDAEDTEKSGPSRVPNRVWIRAWVVPWPGFRRGLRSCYT